MTQEGQVPPPLVVWAQRKYTVFVTFCLEDCKDPVIDVEPQMIHFKGIGGTEKKLHEVTINLYDEIDPSKTSKNAGDRIIELVLVKKQSGPYWPRLVKENTKMHWLKSDFNKWADESDSEEDQSNCEFPLAHLMQQLDALDDSKKPNMDLMNDDQLSDSDESDDDDDMPDLFD